jgi:hypothetical protein
MDDRWKISTSIFELCRWITDSHQILNTHYIEDGLKSIRHLLIEENVTIEWKSSFLTPLQQEYTNEESEKKHTANVFKSLAKAILGMINTEGGSIVVGVVERPELILRDEVKRRLIKKSGKHFFDIEYELKNYGKSLDGIRLELFDVLKNMTEASADKFNDLVKFEPVILRGQLLSVTVVRVTVQKSPEHLYDIQKDSRDVLWIALTKRAQGQTLTVDARPYIRARDRISSQISNEGSDKY